MIEAVSAALLMGLIGSAHCALMCGPLAIGGCQKRADTAGYFGGRTIAYALSGALFGSLGHAVSLGSTWSFLIAAAMMVHGLRQLAPTNRDPSLVTLRRKRAWTGFMARLLPRRGLGLGLATGALPCGLLAGAWMLAASTTHPLSGALVMLAFAFASLPGLIAPLIAKRIAGRFLRVPPQVTGLLWCALALWVAARPFLSAASGGCH